MPWQWPIRAAPSRSYVGEEDLPHHGHRGGRPSNRGSFGDTITFELVPPSSTTDDSFTFPDSNGGGSWKRTNPKPEIAAIRTRNNDCNGNLIPLCRMMRAWKGKMNVPIGGLLIDTLAYQFIGSWKHRDESYFYYDYMCRDFFAFMADQDKTQGVLEGSRERPVGLRA